MTEEQTFDFVVVGSGMAGASVSYELAQHGRVALLERESQPGYHATGRSAALFSAIYGNASVRSLSRASRRFLEKPPEGFSELPILSPRGELFLANEKDIAALDIIEDGGAGLLRRV